MRASIFKLTPRLGARKANFGGLYAFDQRAVDAMFAKSTMRGGLFRVSASSWIPGYSLQQFQYEGTRRDDSNDVIPQRHGHGPRGRHCAQAVESYVDDRLVERRLFADSAV